MPNTVLTSIFKRFLCSSSIRKMKYLNVAEKNDAAKTIAGFLSKGTARRREGYSVYNKIFDFESNVRGKNAKMVMTSVSGHLLDYEFLISYKSWKNCDPQQLFDAPIRKGCSEDSEKIKKTLEREIKSCQGLIIWTDCDREGENIGFEIIQVCTAIKPNIPVYRAKFSEITATSVRRALANLTDPDRKQSEAVDVRQQLDLRTGAAFTRFQTIRLQRIFPTHIADKLISYGSCQIPTLGFVARRYKEVEEFVSEAFWKIKVTHTIDDLTVEFVWDRNRLFDKEACEDYLMLCLAEPKATVISVTTKPKNKWRPCPMDTVELEKLGSRKLKLAAKETMVIAEKLYTKGIISYPRTETNIFSPDINLRSLVEQHTSHPEWGPFASRVLEWGPNPRKGNKSDQAHPPIHPIKFATSLSGNEQRVYELIVRHFLACVSKDATGSETVVNITIAGEKFHATGLCIYERNYLDVYVYEKWNAKQIHRYENGQTFDPTEISMQEGCTTAPPLLTEADLIALMEKHGIGTDATHAEHIHKIKERGYIGEAERGLLVPGTIGMGLYEGYDAMELSLAYPTLRAEFEADLKKICTGEKNPQDVLREQIIKYKEAYRIFTEKIRTLDENVAKRLNETIQNSAESVQEPSINRIEEFFKCPKCQNAPMSLKRKRDNTTYFLGCLNFPDCRHSIWFPEEIIEIIATDRQCDKCGPGYRIMKIKFKQNSFLMLLNSVGCTYTTCIGCDSKFQNSLNINVDSVKSVGRIIASSTDSETTVSAGNRNGLVTRNNTNNSGNSSVNNNIRPANSRSISTNNSSVSANSNSSRYHNYNQNNNRPRNNNSRRTPLPNTTGNTNNDDLFENDGFDDFLVSPELEEVIASNTSNNSRNTNANNASSSSRYFNSNYDSHSNIGTANRNPTNNYSRWGSHSKWNTDSRQDSHEVPSRTNISWDRNGQSNNAPQLDENDHLNDGSSWSSTANIPWGRDARNNFQNNTVKCTGCYQPAKLLTTKREGPNQGRMFYRCPKQSGSCQFFAWADEENEVNQSNQNGSILRNTNNSRSDDLAPSTNDNFNTSSEQVLNCSCQQPVKNLVVRKDGPNKGRHFYSCANRSCNFFKWVDETESPSNGQVSSWGSGFQNPSTSNWGTSNNQNSSNTNWGSSSEPSGSKERKDPKKRRCGLCRQEGHTKIKCPRKEEFNDNY